MEILKHLVENFGLLQQIHDTNLNSTTRDQYSVFRFGNFSMGVILEQDSFLVIL